MIAEIKTRLAEIQHNITGIRRAYAQAPASLPESDMPLFCNFTGQSSVTMLNETLAEETRTFLMRLYVRPIQSGIDGEAERLLEPFFERVRAAFLAHPKLGLGTPGSALNWVEKTNWMGDSGATVLQFAGTPYLGVECRLQVIYLAPVTIATHE